MAISASMVKELRERTGAGMMECKKALTEAGGDMEAAVEAMRISGLAKADKKSGNQAAEGVVAIKVAADGSSFGMVEINSQTDFAAKAEDFIAFTDKVVDGVLVQQPPTVDDLTVDGVAVEEARKALVAKIGENIQVRRCVSGNSSGGVFGEYSHKPAEIVEKMVMGRVRKYLADITLVGQPFVKNPDQTVAELLKEKGASVTSFHRLEVGEGIEKKEENFAEEVMAQVRGS